MFEHIMLDLETLDNTPTSVILSIGAVRFDFEKQQLDKEFYRVVDITSCQAVGLTIGGDTVQRWMEQSEEARKVFSSEKILIGEALKEFTHYVRDVKESCMWGNGSTFDNVIIRNAYNACKLPVPWSYKRDFCFRTVIKNFPAPREESKIWHNALEDAKAQARTLIRLMRSLR